MARNDAEILKEAKKIQAEKIALQKKSIALTEKEQKQLESLISKQKELRKEIQELRQEKLDALKGEESSIKSMGSMYDNLNQMQKEGLALAAAENTIKGTKGSLSKQDLASVTKIQEINRSIAQLGVDDVEGRKALTNEYNDQMASIGENLHGNTKIVQNLKEQNSLAQNYADMSSEQKDLIQSQHDVLEGVKKTIKGTLMTVKTLYGNITGAVGGLISGLGVVVGKIGAVNSELGTSMFQADGVGRKAGVLSLVFGDAAQTAKDLSAALGDTNKATFELQASVGLMSTNMGISGSEATKLVSAFSMLNGNSTDVALDMSKTSQEFAKQNGIIPAQLMGDLANSTEEFALYGKDGGENILRAAGYAAKLGVNMSTLSGIADGLLDFESSITKELELGAMLGKNINLNKARELAYSGDIEGATKETLKQLGGIQAFNKMDYYQKKQTADLLGVSVAELQKMNSKMENAGSLGNVISENFSVAGEALDAGLNKYLGTGLKGLGGMITASGQLGMGFQSLGLDMGGMVKSSASWLKNMVKAGAQKIFGGGAAKGAGALASKGASSVADKVEVPDTKGASKGGGAGKSLKSLAGGLKAMGNAKVLFGALNLIPTALGFVAIIAGLPGMLGVSLLGVGAGLGLKALGTGFKSLSKAFPGILALSLAALGFILMIPGSVGMLLMGVAAPIAAAGIYALIPALIALGTAMASGVGALGLAALIAMGVGLGVSFALIGAGAMMMGKGIQLAAQGFATLLPTLSTFMAGITFQQVALVGLFALSLLGLGASLGILAIASLFALPGLLGLGFALMVIGVGVSLLGSALTVVSTAVASMSENMSTFATGLSSVLDVITFEKVAAMGMLAMAFTGLAGSLLYLGIVGLVAVPVMMGIGLATMLLGVAFNILGAGMQAVGLGLSTIMTSLGGLVAIIGPITMLSLALLGLSGALMGLGLSMAFLGLAGLPGLLVLGGISAMAEPIIKLASFFGLGGTAEAGGSEETGALEAGSMSEYETNMLSKMDQLIQATTSQRDIYLDKDKVTNIVMDRGERSAVNKFKLNRA
jgi:DNA-binding PadR family transcriptional regulator